MRGIFPEKSLDLINSVAKNVAKNVANYKYISEVL